MSGDFVGFSRNSKGELLYSIKAVTDSRICLFFNANVLRMTSEHPEIVRRLIELQLNDTVLCQQRLLNLGQKSVTEGLSYLIMELYYRPS